jgi:hypothetical protein
VIQINKGSADRVPEIPPTTQPWSLVERALAWKIINDFVVQNQKRKNKPKVDKFPLQTFA